MDHQLVTDVEKALGWSGPGQLGREFTRGTLPDPQLCARLLTPTRLLDLVMRRSLTQPQIRCLQDGHELHPRQYTTTSRTRRGQAIPMVDMARLGQLLADGCTLVLDAADTFDPTMEVACRALQWWAGELVQVNIYLTTQQAAGFDLHWDDHDVLVVQLAGEKSWEVRGASRAVPMYRDAEPNLAPSDEVLWAGAMAAGDVLHIPRGYWHMATRTDREQAGSGFSLHATFGFVQRTGADWVTWLADQSRRHELFRRDLDGDASPAGELAAAVAELAAAATPQEFLATRAREQHAPRHVATRGVFGPVTAAVCITEFPPEVTIDKDGAVTVAAAGRRIRFGAAALPALRLLLSGQPISLAEITAATGLDATPLVDVLLQEKMCAEATPELFSGYTGLVPTATFSKQP